MLIFNEVLLLNTNRKAKIDFMKRFLTITAIGLLIAFNAIAKPWPTDALTRLKQSTRIETQYLSALAGSDISQSYATRLLQTYKSSYPDYSAFEKYISNYQYTCDPIRVSVLKQFANAYNFNAVWNILENGSQDTLNRLKRQDINKYNRLKSLVINRLQRQFGTVGNFTEKIVFDGNNTNSVISRIIQESISEL